MAAGGDALGNLHVRLQPASISRPPVDAGGIIAIINASNRAMASIAVSVLAILLCGGLGALAGFGLSSAIGWSGVGGAIVAALTGMVVATLAWIAGSMVLRRLGWLR